MNPAMKGLLITDILIRFCEQIPYAFVVVWSMKVIAAPVSALQFGLLTTIEMATTKNGDSDKKWGQGDND